MIRTVILTAALLAVAGVADAATIKVSLAGKTEAALKVEISKAAEAVCSEAPVLEYFACVHETYADAMAQVAKARAMRTAALTF